MIEKKNEVAPGVSLKDAKLMQALYKAIGTLSHNNQVALLKMTEKRLKSMRLAAEVAAYEDGLYRETWMRAKGRPHR